MVIRRSTLLPLLSALLALAACDGPTDPGDRLAVEVLEGNAQEGLPDELLPAEIVVRVLRADGSPADGVAVTFRAADGAGTVQAAAPATDAYGIVRATWRLPAQAGAPLSVTAQVDGAAEPARFTAGWLPRERADLLLADAGTRVRLLLHAPGSLNLTAAFAADFQDSLIVAPFANPQVRSAILAFTVGRPPLVRADLPWTARRDTLRLAFPQPVAVPLTLWIIRGPYETVRSGMEVQLEGARNVWARAGITFPDVRWVDATAHPNAGQFQGTTEACGSQPGMIGRDAERTNVYVTGPIVYRGVGYGGYACSADFIAMSSGGLGAPTLLAHELGHTFGLAHQTTDANVMDPVARYYNLTAGQIFRAHAHTGSALQLLYADRAVVPALNCGVPGACLDPGLDM
jgi:hypothetical protein